jgi:hypothetical protein
MPKVLHEHYGIIHCIARCDDCSWWGDDINSGQTRRNAKNHVIKTGHVVQVETGTATRYGLAKTGEE